MAVALESGVRTIPQSARLLLVEDDPEDASFVEKVLSDGKGVDFAVHWVCTLDAAKKVAEAEPFDMVILDLNLPDSHGSETLFQLRPVVGDEIPIIVLSEDENEFAADSFIYRDKAEHLSKLKLDRRIVPRLLHTLLQRQRTERSLLRLIATNPDGIVVVNVEGTVVFANPAASDLFGRPIGELVDQQFGFPVVGGGVVEIDVAGQRVAEMRVVEINWRDDCAWLTSLRDITDRKRFEEELRDAKIAAEMANRAKSSFLACMSHELRTPLNSIIGFSEMMDHDILPGGHATCQEYARIIHNSGKHLLSIVNDVLDVAAVEAGKVTLDCQIIDVHQAISSSLQMVSKMAREKRIQLSDLTPPVMIPLYADYRRVRQIVINLLTNAIKYTLSGGIVTTNCTCDADGLLSIFVEDNGIGIAPEDLERVLAPFGRVGSPYTSREQGTGLGLYITRILIELHGGTLTIESEMGRGTRVAARFPAERVVPYRV